MENDLKSRLDKIATTDTNKTSTILPWDRFQNWFHCICIVTFDLELGQAMEVGRESCCHWRSASATH